jgi:hypothetical protein
MIGNYETHNFHFVEWADGMYDNSMSKQAVEA